MRRLSERKSTGRVLFAPMPPTLAAASTMYWGFCSAMKASTASRSRRSSSADVAPTRFSNPADSRCRQMAEPTRPRCPAT